MCLVQNGDIIALDIEARSIELKVAETELERRRQDWRPPKAKFTRGALVRYAALVGSAAGGAVLKGN